MSDGLGEPIASGRAADVFDLGDGRVLRRYRTDRDCGPEARLMAYLLDAGVPVPMVHEASGRDLVMERVPGPTMLEDMEAHPWRLLSHVRTLARLQESLGDVPAPQWMQTDERVPEGSAILHLDLHPMNVIVGADGPVLIDWTNARRGDADFDAAMSFLLVATFEARGAKERVAQSLVSRLFRSIRGPQLIQGRLVDAATFRLQDANVTEAERHALEALIANHDPVSENW